MGGITYESPLVTGESVRHCPAGDNALADERTNGWLTAMLLKTVPRT